MPYPCIKILDDKFELYLDFHLVTETTSCTTAIALLLSLYHVFEIRFAHHNRCCRLLYGVLFEDSHFLNKSIRNLLNKWNYKIINQPSINRQAMITNLIQNSSESSIVDTSVSPTSLSSASSSDKVHYLI